MPSTQPRNADFLVAIAALLFYYSLSFPPPDPRRCCSAASFASPLPPLPRALHTRFTLGSNARDPIRVHTRARTRAIHTRLGRETKRDTPPAISKMAEFNGQTLGRYSPLAMKIKVGGGGDSYRCAFSFHRVETAEGETAFLSPEFREEGYRRDDAMGKWRGMMGMIFFRWFVIKNQTLGFWRGSFLELFVICVYVRLG